MTNLDALLTHALRERFGVNEWRAEDEGFSEVVIQHIVQCLSAALASAEPSPPTTDDTYAVIEEGKRVSDNPYATPADLRFALNAAIHKLGEQREMYRARLRETEQDAKLRVRAALASASAPCGVFPKPNCGSREWYACVKEVGHDGEHRNKSGHEWAAPPRAPETPSQPQDWNNKALWATGAPETPQTCETPEREQAAQAWRDSKPGLQNTCCIESPTHMCLLPKGHTGPHGYEQRQPEPIHLPTLEKAIEAVKSALAPRLEIKLAEGISVSADMPTRDAVLAALDALRPAPEERT